MQIVHDIHLRVYWEDTDAGGVVFYANYLKYFERARTEWLRQLGLNQEAMRTDLGLMFVVSSTSVNYKAPARLDDWLRITVAIQQARKASVHLTQQAWRDDRLLAEGDVRMACVDAKNFRPVPIPSTLASRFG